MKLEINEAFYLRSCLQVTNVPKERLVWLGAVIAALAYMGQKGHLAPPPKRPVKEPQLETLGKLAVMALRHPGFFDGLALDEILAHQCNLDCPAARNGQGVDSVGDQTHV